MIYCFADEGSACPISDHNNTVDAVIVISYEMSTSFLLFKMILKNLKKGYGEQKCLR